MGVTKREFRKRTQTQNTLSVAHAYPRGILQHSQARAD